MGIIWGQKLLKKMEYKFKPLEFNIKSVDEIKFPLPKDRVIEKRGHVVEFTLNEVEQNTKMLEKTFKEVNAKREIEQAKMENIEHFHPFVKETSEEDLHTSWMYYEAKQLVKLCETKMKEIDEQMESDAKEVAEIKAQIPELVEPIVAEAEEIINEDAGKN